MALVCIILALLIERSVSFLDRLRNYRWFDAYSKIMMRNLPGVDQQGAASIIILLLPVLIPIGLLQYFLAGHCYELFSFSFALMVLIYSLGSNLNRDIKHYLQACESGATELAQQRASAILGKPAAANTQQQTIDVMHGLLQQSNMRVFAVLFWFVLLGPGGALLYRLTCHTLHHSPSQTLSRAAYRLEAVLSWLPVNLLALSFALAGDYGNVSEGWRNKPKQNDLATCNYHTLVKAGIGAIGNCEPGDEIACIQAMRSLLKRSLIIWLAVIALLTLIGWMA